MGERPEAEASGIGGEVEQLTPRETEVLEQLAVGKSNREIAEALVISIKTVEVHVSSILGKLEVNSRTEVAALAARRGWLDGTEGHLQGEDP